jgi:hypothetical protein
MKIASTIQVLKKFYLMELFLLLPILYSFKIAVNDRDFAQMGVTVCLLFLAWLVSILKSAKYIAKLSTSETPLI